MDALCKLSLYEQRIRRAVEKATAALEALQEERRRAERELFGAATEADARVEAEILLDGLDAAEASRDGAPPARPAEAAPPANDADPAPADAPSPAAPDAPAPLGAAPSATPDAPEREPELDRGDGGRPAKPRPPVRFTPPPPLPGPDASIAEIEAWTARSIAHLEDCFAPLRAGALEESRA